MIRLCLLSLGAAVLLATTTSLVGCGRAKPAPLKSDQFLGTWIELPDALPKSNRVATPKRASPKMRKITLNADGTFKMELADNNGNVSETKNITGQWKLEESVLIFDEAQIKNGLGKSFDGWLPAATSATVEETNGETRISLTHKDGGYVVYKKL